MTAWTKLLRRPEMIDTLFERDPSLAGFALSEISWEREKRSCMMRGSLAEFADFPRTNWEDDANRVGIRLWLEGIDSFEMKGWSFDNIVDLEISQIEGGSKLRVVARGTNVLLRIDCTSLHVADVFAYHSMDAEPVN